ncbi:conserved protein of unknown function (Bacteriophage Mu, Gp37 1-173) [Magnetospirillum sp. XM-1]|uniref:phage protein Gp37 n=1 Tax=Magnetospirillum sp. XM-1 TaxID=1663591 RepID=UPI00073DF74F|nr:phage protein Gp37 [Magnetospirillum sp. XM-1]CUW41139.1 conserved protein of unknown function (Bacteriophage Mu, Gp37 1-173) [Magnetospirillum sp. XM-1]
MIDAIITAALDHIRAHQGAGKALGYAIPRIEAFDGQVNETQMAQLLQTTPAVFVAFAKGTGAEQGSRRHWTATLSLIVVTRNLATEGAARAGKGAEIGAYRIAEDMAVLFDRRTLDLEIDAIEPVEITPIVPGWARTQKAAIVGLTCKTGFTTAIPGADLAALDDFLRARFDFDLPPSGNGADTSTTANTRPS